MRRFPKMSSPVNKGSIFDMSAITDNALKSARLLDPLKFARGFKLCMYDKQYWF